MWYSEAMKDKFSLRQFKRKYGTHEACLEAIKKLRFPNLEKIFMFNTLL
jgi:hypothetical protein